MRFRTCFRFQVWATFFSNSLLTAFSFLFSCDYEVHIFQGWMGEHIFVTLFLVGIEWLCMYRFHASEIGYWEHDISCRPNVTQTYHAWSENAHIKESKDANSLIVDCICKHVLSGFHLLRYNIGDLRLATSVYVPSEFMLLTAEHAENRTCGKLKIGVG